MKHRPVSGTFYLPYEVYGKAKELAYMERKSITKLVAQLVTEHIRKYEEEHGEIQCCPDDQSDSVEEQ